MTTQDTIAHYRITGKLGAGGMGEVYRATDTKLGRDVALKVIPEHFAQDAIRMSRFRREAQVLASLNHPNIAAIYGVEDRALVMELVEGITLAERISQGPIPLEEALPIARQIAAALEYAHEHGVVHRDLKPANIKITPEGRVKVLDFGLAKALSSDAANASSDPELSPTITLKNATEGIVVGTAGYMSPEQARGKTVDKRTDIWAFGVVLVEMLTGRSLFTGETVSDTLAAVLRSDIDYSHLPPETPPVVRNLIERCLERDQARRLRDIGDAGILMDSAPASVVTAATRAKAQKKWLAWAAGLAGGAALAACIAWFLWPVYSPQPIRFEVSSPEGALVFYPAVSPDGRSIAFVQAKTNLDVYVRRLDQLENVLVPGSEASNSRPFWSPDSRRLGFFAGGKLNTVNLDGGDVQTLIDGLVGNATSYSGAWSSTGAILFTQAGKPIYRLPETGGAVTPLLSFDASRGETAQLLGSFLPDGRHFLYTSISRAGTDIYEGSLDGSKPAHVLNSASVLGFAHPAGSRTGYLLFYSRNQILLRPFDPGSARLSGNAVVVQSGVSNSVTLSPNASAFVASGVAGSISGGTLVYDDLFNASRQITWFSRQGQTLDQAGGRNPGRLMDVRISPDQQDLVYADMERNSDIWLAYVRHEGSTRLTFSEGNALSPVFSPQGDRIAYTSARSSGSAILIRSANGTGTPEMLFETRTEMHPVSWSPNGKWLACMIGEPGRWDIDLLPVAQDSKPVPLVNTPFDEYQPQFSPDGHWIAYTSNESGRYEIYIVNVPQSAGGPAAVQGRWQVSTAGGQQPRWRADGKELFFISQRGEMMSVKVDPNAHTFQASTPQALFATGLVPIGPTYLYDVSADGSRFVLLKSVGGVAPPLRVIVNWASAFGLQ